MPNAIFTYNDMNWVDSEKREQIIKIVKQIQEIEQKYRAEGKLSEQEKGLIDTIGFEAHLTTDVTPEQIEQTFKDVEELRLPIEITELDIARVGTDPSSIDEITKQNMIIDKFIDLVKQGRVTALTVWSQSDEMSFMNDKCEKNVYASVILDENLESKEFEPLQKFNYHTHTSLCGHADGTMEEYIQKAIDSGITSLGFSDHVPNPLGKDNPTQAMSLKRFHEEYIPTLKQLKEKYSKDIDIKIGLESEYYGDMGEELAQLKSFREQTEKHLDYMILGQHSALSRDEDGKLKMPPSISDKKSAKYPIDYAITVVEAIKSGKFAYVAHPDIFLESRDKVYENEKDEYMKNAEIATRMICQTASEYGIPLEINLGSISAIEAGIKDKIKDGSYAYPVPSFWKVAQEYGCDVLIGIDAHTPEALREKNSEIIAKKLLKNEDIDLVFLENFTPKGIGKEISTPEERKKAFFSSRKFNTKSNDEAEQYTSTELSEYTEEINPNQQDINNN